MSTNGKCVTIMKASMVSGERRGYQWQPWDPVHLLLAATNDKEDEASRSGVLNPDCIKGTQELLKYTPRPCPRDNDIIALGWYLDVGKAPL